MSSVDLSKLESAVKEMVHFSSRTITEVVNQKALNIHGRWMNNLPKADKAQIQRELGVIARALRTTKKGRLVGGKRIYAKSATSSAPLAVLIINARRRARGEKGLTGNEMRKAIDRMVGARKRSSGFNASGNVPGIKTLAGVIRKPFIIARMSGISVVGKDKGEAIPAKESFNPMATIINTVKSIEILGVGYLQDAIDAETADTIDYIERAMASGVQRFNRN